VAIRLQARIIKTRRIKMYATYNKYGYSVRKNNGEEVYSAGNCRFDSSTSATVNPESPEALSLDEIRKFAIQTGEEIAEELGFVFTGADYED
jgi:hypothetical protein